MNPYARFLAELLWDPTKEFAIEMIFSSKDVVMASTKEHHLRRHHQFHYDEMKKKTYSIKYKDKSSNYKWHLYTSKKKRYDV